MGSRTAILTMGLAMVVAWRPGRSRAVAGQRKADPSEKAWYRAVLCTAIVPFCRNGECFSSPSPGVSLVLAPLHQPERCGAAQRDPHRRRSLATGRTRRGSN